MTVRIARAAQQVVSILGLVAVIAYGNSYAWPRDVTAPFVGHAVLIGVVALPGLMTLVSWAGRGDITFLAGSLLFVNDVLLPQNLSVASYMSNVPVLTTMTIVTFGAMAVVWWFRLTAPALILVLSLCSLLIVGDISSEDTAGPIISLVGVVACLIGVLLGDGSPVGEEIEFGRLGVVAAVKRLGDLILAKRPVPLNRVSGNRSQPR